MSGLGQDAVYFLSSHLTTRILIFLSKTRSAASWGPGDQGVGRGESHPLPGDLSLEVCVDETGGPCLCYVSQQVCQAPLEASRALPRLDGRWPGTRSLSRIRPL